MKLSLLIALVTSILLTGCFKGEGQVRIESDVQNAIIYIDGDKKGMTGDGYTTVILEEGEHKVRIYKEKDEEWFYEGTQDIFVGANSSVKIMIKTDTKPTEFRLEKLAKEKKEREIREAKEKKEREERLAREKIEEEIRLAKEKKEREERVAKEKKAEEERLTIEKKEREAIAKEFGLSSYPIGTFFDVDTKLMWQDNNEAKSLEINWREAKIYCNNLILAEKNDWYLPTLKQLQEFYKKTPKLKNIVINKYPNYWSETEGNSASAYRAKYGTSDYSKIYKSFAYNVRCVRGI